MFGDVDWFGVKYGIIIMWFTDLEEKTEPNVVDDALIDENLSRRVSAVKSMQVIMI